MSILTVSVAGQASDSRLLTLPFEVFSTRGERLGKGTASPAQPARIELRDERVLQPGRVYVLAKLPNGKQVQEVAELLNGQGNVTLLQSTNSPSDWLEWLKPFRSLKHLNAKVQVEFSPAAPLRRIGEVWRMVWALNNGQWESSKLEPSKTEKEGTIQQFWFDVPNRPHLLQIGGDDIAWRIISLPPGGEVRVALTPSDKEIGNSMDITIGRRDADNELIMSYLARGAMEQVTSLADAWQTADQMLQGKYQDPVGAVAGAYVLLKLRRLDQRRDWMENLVTSFPHLADAAIVSAAFLLQDEVPDETLIRARIKQALENGLPVFTLGAKLLVETMAAIHRGEEESSEFQVDYLQAKTYARAICTQGAYLAFYGTTPKTPSTRPTYGPQNSPKSTPLDWMDELKALQESFKKRIATRGAGITAQVSLDAINREARLALNMPEIGAAEVEVSLNLEPEPLDVVRANQAAVIIPGEQ
ncbi:hypothetical protein [Pseudomonas sp.]|uniref:hypothetical protein n=1 Tax=Pseudomonas sp. TaxID=306 RepID=UPI00299E9D74|nr:hypothetical protein [Pseudomonas sp.]MDX1366891.1 hypothetical protein [Pseudomonas sp.]